MNFVCTSFFTIYNAIKIWLSRETKIIVLARTQVKISSEFLTVYLKQTAMMSCHDDDDLKSLKLTQTYPNVSSLMTHKL